MNWASFSIGLTGSPLNDVAGEYIVKINALFAPESIWWWNLIVDQIAASSILVRGALDRKLIWCSTKLLTLRCRVRFPGDPLLLYD